MTSSINNNNELHWHYLKLEAENFIWGGGLMQVSIERPKRRLTDEKLGE
jgi:hypothetical protein